jgi:hypothetical protein
MAKRGRPSSGPPDERLNGEPHFMERKEEGSADWLRVRQRNWQKETIYYTARLSAISDMVC